MMDRRGHRRSPEMVGSGAQRAWQSARTLVRMLPLCVAAAAAGLLAACAPAATGTAGVETGAVVGIDPMPQGAGDVSRQSDSLVPAGHGTLRQDQVTVSLRNGAVLVKVTPLDEAVIRTLAPDTYDRLRSLRESRREEVERTTMGGTEMFLVSFFSYEPDAAFQPEDLQIVYQSRLLRPNVVVPLTTGWGRQRLDQQETQTAIYGFETDIDYGQVMTVRYGMAETDQWRQIIVLLANERGRIRSRSGD